MNRNMVARLGGAGALLVALGVYQEDGTDGVNQKGRLGVATIGQKMVDVADAPTVSGAPVTTVCYPSADGTFHLFDVTGAAPLDTGVVCDPNAQP